MVTFPSKACRNEYCHRARFGFLVNQPSVALLGIPTFLQKNIISKELTCWSEFDESFLSFVPLLIISGDLSAFVVPKTRKCVLHLIIVTIIMYSYWTFNWVQNFQARQRFCWRSLTGCNDLRNRDRYILQQSVLKFKWMGRLFWILATLVSFRVRIPVIILYLLKLVAVAKLVSTIFSV